MHGAAAYEVDMAIDNHPQRGTRDGQNREPVKCVSGDEFGPGP